MVWRRAVPPSLAVTVRENSSICGCKSSGSCFGDEQEYNSENKISEIDNFFL